MSGRLRILCPIRRDLQRTLSQGAAVFRDGNCGKYFELAGQQGCRIRPQAEVADGTTAASPKSRLA
jgi:hypothetical protein